MRLKMRTLAAFVWSVPFLFIANLLATTLEAQEPGIEMNHVPAYGSQENLRGRIVGVDPAAYQVAPYLFVEGLGWWFKPFATAPCTRVAADGRFEVDVTTGGVDQLSHRYAVFLLPIGQPCPVVLGAEYLPEELLVRPSKIVERTPYTLEFAGYRFVIRNSPYAGGPGGNCFSPDNAFVDGQGRLHLRLGAGPPDGFCGGEVWLDRSLGIGEYRIHTIGRVDILDPAAVFGIFTWDPDARPAHREMDIELSRWCVPNDPSNSQVVVQPFNEPGHRVRFPIDLTDDSTELTYLMDWQPDVVTFSVYHGHHLGDPPPDRLIFQHVFTDGVPAPGQERFRFNLWKACDSLAQSQEVVIAHFNGPLPFLSIDDVSIEEGNASGVNADFTVTLDKEASGAFSVSYTTSDGSATASDYKPVSGTLTFPSGTTSRTVRVPVLGDTLAEPMEFFFLDLSAPMGAKIENGTGRGTILDNDISGSIEFSLADYSVSEAMPRATIAVKRTGGAASGVTVAYATSDETATPGEDYASTSGTLSFDTQITTQTFQIPIFNDTVHEPGETIRLKLSNPGGYGAMLGLQETAVLTIADNDPAGKVRFSATSYSGLEGVQVPVTVRRTRCTTSSASVKLSIGGGTATEGEDYMAQLTLVDFGPGVLKRTVPITLTADLSPEGNETVLLTLSDPDGCAELGTPHTATLTILDAQSTVAFTAPEASVNERAASLALVINRTGPLSKTVSVIYTTADGTAMAGSDYRTTSGTLTFRPKQKTKTVVVPLKRDTVVERDETFTVTLSEPTGGAALGVPARVTVTIVENDVGGRLQFSAASYKAREPLGARPSKARIFVQRTEGVASDVSVNYAVVGGSATSSDDFMAKTGTLHFGTGVIEQSFTIDIRHDTSPEDNETILLSLDTPTGGGTLGPQSTAILTVLDNDSAALPFSAETRAGARSQGARIQ